MKKRINVLHIIDQLSFGGAELLLFTLAVNIDRSRFNMMVCCWNDGGPVADQLLKEGIKVFCLKEPRLRYSYRKIINLVKIIKGEKISILHTHLPKADFAGRLIARICGVPVVCKTRHDYKGSSEKGYPGYHNYLKINILLDHLTDMVIYVSQHESSVFKKREKDWCVIHNTIHRKRFDISSTAREEKRKELNITPDEMVIGSVARLTETKGQKYLLYAVKKIKETKKDISIRLLLIGDGDMKDELNLLAEKLDISNETLFIGKTQFVAELMYTMDIFVHPAIFEPFGIAVVEAMYAGLPVISSRVGGIPEIVEDGVDGVLVEPRDSNAIANAILDLIDNPGKRSEVAMRGKEKTMRYTEKHYAEKMADLYERLLSEKLRKG